jgi:hypothetical protein
VEAYAKLHVSKRLVGAGGSPVILRDRLWFYVPFIFDDFRGKLVAVGSGVRMQSGPGGQG